MTDLGAPLPPRPSTARRSLPPMAAVLALSRPRVVSVSFWCWLASSLLLGATTATAATKIEPMHAEFARLAGTQDAEATQVTIDRVAAASVLLVIGTGATAAVLGLALAGALRVGRNWARVILTALALIAVAYAALVSTVVTDAMLGDLRSAVRAGLMAYTTVVLVAAICMYLPGTTPWFRRPRGR
jgi:hypothetical protein